VEEFEIDFMFIADGAQSVGGKLYVLGGGWSHVLLPQLPGRPPAPFAVAIGLTVPWNLTNRRFAFELELVDADGERIDEAASGEFEQGRPPGLRAGTPQRIVLAIPVHPEFPAAGRYSYGALIDGQRLASTSFEVVAAEPQAQQG
jgi:uncharacterized protein DUF6941